MYGGQLRHKQKLRRGFNDFWFDNMSKSCGSGSHKNTQSAPWTFPTGLCKHSRQTQHVQPPFTSRQKHCLLPRYYGHPHAEPFRQLFLCVSVCVCVLSLFAMLCFPAGGGSDLERMQWNGRSVQPLNQQGWASNESAALTRAMLIEAPPSMLSQTHTHTVRSVQLQSVETNNRTIRLKGRRALLLTAELKHFHWLIYKGGLMFNYEHSIAEMVSFIFILKRCPTGLLWNLFGLTLSKFKKYTFNMRTISRMAETRRVS